MATIEADRRACRLRAWVGGLLAAAAAVAVAVASCAPPAGPALPAPEPTAPSLEPELRLGLAVGTPAAMVGGLAPLTVSDPSGAHLAEIPAGETWRATVSGTGVAVTGVAIGSTPSEVVVVVPAAAGGPVRINGRLYRGMVTIFRDGVGLTVVNRVRLESYLRGVVSAEMGRRGLGEQEALRAQAIVSRTFALRNLRRWDAQGFDLYATVADQVYGGMGAETPEGDEAVGATRGRILTSGGTPIDAFFYSTCGGRTAEGTEVFRGAERSYLRSLADVADDGTAYCAISPRFRWREEWTGEALRTTLQRTLPAIGVAGDQASEVRDVRVTYRTGSGRVGQLTLALRGSEVRVEGPSVRQVLRPPTGDLLRSTAFTLTATGDGRRISHLVAEGSGAGHGVGFCQWGAVGRSRAGHDHERILAAYFPGTTLERLY